MKRENELKEFEVQMEDDRNEGLFFKNLRKKTPFLHWLVGHRNSQGYCCFISTDWRKVAVLFAILVALTSQFIIDALCVMQ